MSTLALSIVPSPLASPTRPPAVAATHGRWAAGAGLAAGITLREAPAVRLGCGLRRSERGGRDGHGMWRDGQQRIV
jgi:hypothetical protein